MEYWNDGKKPAPVVSTIQYSIIPLLLDITTYKLLSYLENNSAKGLFFYNSQIHFIGCRKTINAR